MVLRARTTGTTLKACLGTVFAIGLCTSTALAAETAKPAAAPSPAPVSAVPATTTALFGDWLLKCQRLPDGSKPSRVCEVSQTIQVQGQQAPIAQIAIGRLAPDKPLDLTVVLPSNITLPSVVLVGLKDKQKDLAWTRCTPAGCFASGALTDDVLKVWRGAADPGKLSFKDAAGRDIGFPVSFKGLPQALDALASEQ